MNKIAIIGAHGSGKTTLIEKIQNESTSSTLSVIDIARVCPLLVGKESTQEAQEWILNLQLALEKRLSGKIIPSIFDGCSLSHLAYYQYWGGDTNKFSDRIFKSISYFDRIFLLPANPHFLFDDGLRPIESNFQRQIFKIQKELLDNAGIEYQIYNPLKAFSLSTLLKTNTETAQCAKKIQCVVRHKQNYLFLKRKPMQLTSHDDLWELISGDIESGETLNQAAERLVLEQTGYLSTTTKPMQMKKCTERQKVLECLVTESTRFTNRMKNGIIDDKWVSKDEFIDIMKKAEH